MPETFVKGEEVFYVLPRAPGNRRPVPLYLRVRVLNVTPDRVVVRNVTGPRFSHRVLKASKLTHVAPEGAWIR